MLAYAKQKPKQKPKSTVQKKEREKAVAVPNLTGIPDTMKTRFENLSGFSFDDVRVHYNSDKPAQLQALAYTQGNQVYVAPGQEKHLGHELGHVVQQKQGRVQPMAQSRGLSINNNAGLEKEADEIAKTMIIQEKTTTKNIVSTNTATTVQMLLNKEDARSFKAAHPEQSEQSIVDRIINIGDTLGDAEDIYKYIKNLDKPAITSIIKIY